MPTTNMPSTTTNMPTMPNSQPNEPIRSPGLVSGILKSTGQVARHLVAHGRATLSLDLRALATCRILVGLLLAYECWTWADGLDLLFQTSGRGAIMAPTDVPFARPPPDVRHNPSTYRNAGAHDTALALNHTAERALHSVAFYRGPYWFQAALLAIQLLAAILLTLGLHTRAASVASFLLHWATVGRAPAVMCGSQRILLLLLLWTMFLPVGLRGAPQNPGNPLVAARGERPGTGSQQRSGAGTPGPGKRADAGTARGDGNKNRDVKGDHLLRHDLCWSAATAGITLQVALVYVLVVTHRLHPRWLPEWTLPELSALYYAVVYGHGVRAAPAELLLGLPRVVLQVLTAGAMVVEIAAPVLLLATRADRWARVFPVALLISLHVGVFAIMAPGNHPQVGMIGAVLLLPSPFWDWAGWPRGPVDGGYDAGDASTDVCAGDGSTRVPPGGAKHSGCNLHSRAPLVLYVRGPAGPGISPDATGAEGATQPLPLLPCLVGAATWGRVSPRWAMGSSDSCAGVCADGAGEQVGGLAGIEGCHHSGNVTPPSPGSYCVKARRSVHDAQAPSIRHRQASLGNKGTSAGTSQASGAAPMDGRGTAQPSPHASTHAPPRVPTPALGWWLADGQETLTGQAAARKVASLLPGGRLLQVCPRWLHGRLALFLAVVLDWSTMSSPQRGAGVQQRRQGEVPGSSELPGKVLSAVEQGEKGRRIADASGEQTPGPQRGRIQRLGVWCQHTMRRLVSAFTWVWLAYTLLEGAGNLGLIHKVDGGKLGRVLNLDQDFYMYSPPSRAVRWFAIVGTVQVVGAGGRNVSVSAAGDVSLPTGSDDVKPHASSLSKNSGQRPLQQLQHLQLRQATASRHAQSTPACQWDVDILKVLKGARKSLLRDAWCSVTRSCGQYDLYPDTQVFAGNRSSVANGDASSGSRKEAVQARACESIMSHAGPLWQPVADKAALFSENVAWTRELFRSFWWERLILFIWTNKEVWKLPSRMHHLGSSFFCNLPELLQGHLGSPDIAPGEQLAVTQVELAFLISPSLPPASPRTRGPPRIMYRKIVNCGQTMGNAQANYSTQRPHRG
eukprot:jgi/Mesvir1/16878/Mv15762-RA.1